MFKNYKCTIIQEKDFWRIWFLKCLYYCFVAKQISATVGKDDRHIYSCACLKSWPDSSLGVLTVYGTGEECKK